MRKSSLAQGILFTLVSAFAVYNLNFMHTRQVVVKKAGCPLCLCMNAPTCADVIVEHRGLPFVNKQHLLYEEYVEEPYLSMYKEKTSVLGFVGNTAIALFGSAFILSSARKYMRVRKKQVHENTRY